MTEDYKPINSLSEQSSDKEIVEKTQEQKIQDIVKTIMLLSHDPSPRNINSYRTQISLLNFTDKELWKISKIITNIFPEDKHKELREIIDSPIFDRLKDQRKKNLIKDKTFIKKLNNTRIKINGMPVPRPRKISGQRKVGTSLRDKETVSQKEFSGKGEKGGMSTGYSTVEPATGHTFYLKHVYKSHDDCLLLPILYHHETQDRAIQDRQDVIPELIASTMYQFLLYDRVPKNALVTGDVSHPNSLYIRSKSLENAKTLAKFLKAGVAETDIRVDNTNLHKLEGFEKVIVACHILGDTDYHDENLMVQNGRTVAKIDHGRSFVEFHKNFAEMVESTYKAFSEYQYFENIQAGNLSFNINKYSEALNQMIHQLDEQQIDAIIDQKLDELKKVFFDPKGIKPHGVRFEGNESVERDAFKDFNDIEIFYKNNLKENLSNMKEIAKDVEIVSKFSNVSTNFKNGEWLEVLANSPIKEPLAYAAHYNIKIEGKSAIDWANDNNYQFKVYNGYTERQVQRRQWEKNINGQWQKKTSDVIEREKDITNLDPKEYIKIAEQLLQFIEDELIAIDNNLQKKQGKISEQEVQDLYDSLLDKLTNERYLTQEECNNIKVKRSYYEHIEYTKDLVNLTHGTPISSLDKIRYSIANFCKTPSLSRVRISDDLLKNISPQSLDMISSVDNAIITGAKFKGILLRPILQHRVSKDKINNLRKNSVKVALFGRG